MIKSLLRLMRLYYSLPLAGGLIVITFYVRGGNVAAILKELVLSFLSLACIISAGYVLNDVCDIEIDRINCPNRVIPNGKIKKKTAIFFAFILFLSGIITAGTCNTKFFVIISLVAAGLIFYDVFSKRLGVFKNILAAILVTSLYPLAFALTEPVQTLRLKSLYIFPIWLFLTTIGYQILKDIRDIKGDSNIKRYFIVNLKLLFYLSRTIILAAGLAAFVPYIIGSCKFVYLIAAAISFILTVIAVFKKPQKAIQYIYCSVFLITAGSMADLIIFGP